MHVWHPIIMHTGLLTSSVLNLNYSPQINTFVCGLTEQWWFLSLDPFLQALILQGIRPSKNRGLATRD